MNLEQGARLRAGGFRIGMITAPFSLAPYLVGATALEQEYKVIMPVGERRRCRSVKVDATGVGLSAFLGAASGPSVVLPFRYTAASKSQLAHDYSTVVNSEHFRLEAESADAGANALRQAALRQCEVAENAMRADQVISFVVPEHRRRDDLLDSPRWWSRPGQSTVSELPPADAGPRCSSEREPPNRFAVTGSGRARTWFRVGRSVLD